MVKKAAFLVAAAGLACSASAQFWSDDFESYSVGSEPCGTNSWASWDGSGNVCGEIAVDPVEGDNCLMIEGYIGNANGLGDDTVATFNGVTSGQWEFRIDTYCDSSTFGAYYVILLNQYTPVSGLANNWSVQCNFDPVLGELTAEFGGEYTTLIMDEWVEFKVVFDLDNDTADYYYDGVAFATGLTWNGHVSGDGSGSDACEALDLYAQEPGVGTEGAYFDNPSLTDLGGGCPPDFNGDGILNSQDFIAFLNAFTAGDPSADYNGDGTVNSQDFIAFLNDFVAGNMNADYNGDGTLNSQDFIAFLNDFVAGC